MDFLHDSKLRSVTDWLNLNLMIVYVDDFPTGNSFSEFPSLQNHPAVYTITRRGA